MPDKYNRMLMKQHSLLITKFPDCKTNICGILFQIMGRHRATAQADRKRSFLWYTFASLLTWISQKLLAVLLLTRVFPKLHSAFVLEQEYYSYNACKINKTWRQCRQRKNNNSGISSNEKQRDTNYKFMSITQFKEIDWQ